VSAVGSVTAARHGARIIVADANVETRDYVVRLFGEGWRVEPPAGVAP
jgi:hypothetical protein